ncbi:MAG TPA: hypothetical protein VF774_24775 [Pseudoduganella sp.]|jgi:outer membrane receptor for Fe3+-dicitrate
MTHIRYAALVILAATGMTGCASQERSGTGTSVRAIMASQMLPPQPATNTGTEASTAVAGYANYQRSYVTPTPQTDSAMIGSGISGK